jgi:hypothetical protein
MLQYVLNCHKKIEIKLAFVTDDGIVCVNAKESAGKLVKFTKSFRKVARFTISKLIATFIYQ